MSPSIPRRNLNEVITLYQREPSLHDIYVEGPFDLSILRWLLNELGFKKATLFLIDTIDIEKERFTKLDVKPNHRERLIYFADYYNKKCPDNNQVTCVVDKDFDHITDSIRDNPCLYYTDFTSMELYFYFENIIEKYFHINCNKTKWPTSKILESLSEVLQRLFVYRLANERLNWNMKRYDPSKCIKVNDWNLDFNEDEYITRYLNKNNRLKEKDIFLTMTTELEALLVEEYRLQIHGHDFISLLCWYIGKLGIDKTKVNEDFTARHLALSCSVEHFMQFELFNRLSKIAADTA